MLGHERTDIQSGIPKKGPSSQNNSSYRVPHCTLNKDGNKFHVIVTDRQHITDVQNGVRSFDPSMLQIDRVYVNGNDVASNNVLDGAFGTHNVLECAREICENGRIDETQQTRDQKRQKDGHRKRLMDD